MSRRRKQKRELRKLDIVEQFIDKGYEEDEAKKIMDDFMVILFDNMITGKKVFFEGIGSLSADILAEGSVFMFGEEKKASERLKITFTQSRMIDRTFKKHYSQEAIKRKKVADMAKLLASK